MSDYIKLVQNLRATIRQGPNMHAQAADAIEALTDAERELIELLKPIAAFAREAEGVWRGYANDDHYFAGLRYGDLRRIAAYFEKHGQ